MFAIKSQMSSPKTTTFDVITVLLWRVWTQVLDIRFEIYLFLVIDTRGHHQLLSRLLSFVVGLVSELKLNGLDKDYRDSVVDFMEVNGLRGSSGREGAFVVFDVSKLQFLTSISMRLSCVWWFARVGTTDIPGMVTSLIGFKREDGVEGLLALVSLTARQWMR